jgi:multidrug resistance efflux pump
MALALLALAAPARAAVLTGEVRSSDAQEIFTPPSMSSPVVLRYYVPEGTRVKKGEALLTIDPGEAAAQLRQLKDKIAQTRDTTAKEVADLELKEIDAELALVDAKAALDDAAIDARIPKKLTSALDYDTYQGKYKGAQRDLVLKQQELAAARAAVERRRKDGELQARKLVLQLAFDQAQVDAATVRATMGGVVVHALEGEFSVDGGTRFDEGSTSYPGMKVGEVVASSGRTVRAWALEPDRRGLKVGEHVHLDFDALPGVAATGTIDGISGAAAAKPEWGAGHYYDVGIRLDPDAQKLPLLPGMSVRIETGTRDIDSAALRAPPALIKANGEIRAQKSIMISPPAVEGLWQMNISQMAPDGSEVGKGQPIVTFAAGDLAQKLPAEQSQLAEKLRTRENLRLQLADRARSDELAVAQAKADAEKAARKAQMPEELIAAMEYQKLVVDRGKTAKRLALALRRSQVDASARAAEQRLADDDVTRLQAEVTRMQKALASLTVKAPRDGIFIHHTSWSGDMIDTGSQVWRGMSVGDIPDMHTLVVHASLPERDLTFVRTGQPVRVVLTGSGNGVLAGRIERIGNTVHSESRVRQVPVVDLMVSLAPGKVALKPGLPVRVEIQPQGGHGS